MLNGLRSHELISVFFLSICSGLVAATLGTPADVIKTRIMNNPDLYKGTIDCFKKSVSLKSLFASVSFFNILLRLILFIRIKLYIAHCIPFLSSFFQLIENIRDINYDMNYKVDLF